MIVTGIDPGPIECGVVWYDTSTRRALASQSNLPTPDVLDEMRHDHMAADLIAIEDVDPRGMPLGRDMIATLKVLGRMQEIAPNATWIGRGAVKLALCGSSRASDTNVRSVLLSLFSCWHGMTEKRAARGILEDLADHAWPALGVAVVAAHGVEVAQLARATA